MIKKTSLLTKTKNNNNNNRTNPLLIKDNKFNSIRLFNDNMNCMSLQMKNNLFSILRGVQLLSLLSDVDIRELINGSQFMEL